MEVFMRYIIAGMLLFGVGYSQETDDSPTEIVTPDEGEGGEITISDAYVNWGCGCGKNGGKSK